MRINLFQSCYWILRSKYLFVLLGITFFNSPSSAEFQTFSRFSIAIADGWSHRIDGRQPAAEEFGQLIKIFRVDGVGELGVISFQAPVVVNQLALRNLTNVASSVQLVCDEWGDFSGYQYNYSENGSFFRTWWLANQQTVLFLTYESEIETPQFEIQALDEMVASLVFQSNKLLQ